MNIGIDIDGVLTNLEEETINYGTKMCIENNWEININPEKYSEAERFNWTQEQEEQFWNTYLVKYIKESSSRLFADQAIKKLREEGNQIYIITARNDYGMPEDVEESMQQMTQKWLEKNNIQYGQGYYFSKPFEDKFVYEFIVNKDFEDKLDLKHANLVANNLSEAKEVETLQEKANTQKQVDDEGSSDNITM